MYVSIFLNFIDFRGRKRNLDLLFHLSMHHWLVLIWALTRDQTRNLGVLGQLSPTEPGLMGRKFRYACHSVFNSLLSTKFMKNLIELSADKVIKNHF